ncbi:MAG: hypothetical protein D6820_06960, partial [Lentisphaerae bacterium]
RELFASARVELLAQADRILHEKPLSVTDKTQLPPSGDKHDYLSIAPYWWPNPKTPNGLPWIRKDGQVNPRTRGNHTDLRRVQKLFHHLDLLTFAFFYSGQKKYADKLIQLLDTWFVNPRTRMNPHLKYAQAVPGLNSGRPAGIIEFAGLPAVITAVQILDNRHLLPAQTRQGIMQWFSEYYDWLNSSSFGKKEARARNNHANHYDRQLLVLLLILGRTRQAQVIFQRFKSQRIAKQIRPDGAMPAELQRTKALSYSIMNLRCMTEIAAIAKRFGIDLWNYQTPDGRSLKKAYAFLAPYARGGKKWPYQQIASPEVTLKERLPHLFTLAAAIMNEPNFYPAITRRSALSSLELLKYPPLSSPAPLP